MPIGISSSTWKAVRAETRWRMLAFAAMVAYCYVMFLTIGLRSDHLFLALALAVVLVVGRAWGRRFLVDWSPFVLFWIAYDLMRGVADSLRGRVFVEGPYRLEELLFGWMSPEEVPAFFFQTFQVAHQGEVFKAALDVGSTLVYLVHFSAPLLLGWFFWHTLNERRNFYLFVYTFTALNVMALLTFLAFPTAPPWYVYHHGFGQPPQGMLDSSAGLANFDAMVGRDYLQALWNNYSSNQFAAIPSLHAAYPTLVAWFVWLRYRGRTWLFAAYPLSVWFAAVYLNHHYVIDLVIGAAYVFAAYALASRLLLPRLFDRIVDYGTDNRLARAGGRNA